MGDFYMEEKLVEEYIGENAEKIMNSKTNWSAAILGEAIGPVWFFYRKSYLIGFLFIFITYIVGRIANALNIKEAYHIMFFVYLFTANKLYLWDVKRKINNIKLNNGTISEDEMAELVRKKGGTNIVGAIIYTVFIIATIILSVYISWLAYQTMIETLESVYIN